MPSVNVKGSDENIIEKVLVLQPNVSAEDLQTIQEYVVSATATRINDLEAQVDVLEPIIQNIDTSEANAKASEDNAKISEDNAEDYSLKSQSYAVGTNNTYRAGDATDNAEYYKNQCEAIASSLAGALRPMGTIAFANLPALSTADVGDMYNISDDFVTTSDFTVGAGISYPAGSNVYKIQSDKWDVLVGSAVVGVKGNAENTYRKGNVNITPANIGAYSKSEIDNTVSGLATNTYVNNAVSQLNDEIGVISSGIERITRKNLNANDENAFLVLAYSDILADMGAWEASTPRCITRMYTWVGYDHYIIQAFRVQTRWIYSFCFTENKAYYITFDCNNNSIVIKKSFTLT